MNGGGKGSYDDESSRRRKNDDEFMEERRLSTAQQHQTNNIIATLVGDTKEIHPNLSSSSLSTSTKKRKNISSDESPLEVDVTSWDFLWGGTEEAGSKTTTVHKEPEGVVAVLEQNGVAGNKRGLHEEHVRVTTRDVLCGKTKKAYNHVGNKFFRQIVSNSVALWYSADSKPSRADCIQGIVKIILENGGRFLKQHSITNEWVELDDRQIRDKVGHAIRDAANVSMINKNSTGGKRISSCNEKQSFLSGKKFAAAIVTSSTISRWQNTPLTPPNDSSSTSPTISKKQRTAEDTGFSKKSDDKEEDDNNKDSSEDDFLDYIDDALGPLQLQQQQQHEGNSK